MVAHWHYSPARDSGKKLAEAKVLGALILYPQADLPTVEAFRTWGGEPGAPRRDPVADSELF